jgi:hypothetical protein
VRLAHVPRAFSTRIFHAHFPRSFINDSLAFMKKGARFELAFHFRDFGG